MPQQLFDFVVASDTRLKILSWLSQDVSTPTELAKKIQKHLSHVSRALHELQERELVSCVNPANTKPRVYSLTPQGMSLVNELNSHNFRIHPV
ncbi:MAG: winged helix-turn-helix domain-containing protein [archaeon]|nr:winged helix-turn-helix domain-containing protein [archaeon]